MGDRFEGGAGATAPATGPGGSAGRALGVALVVLFLVFAVAGPLKVLVRDDGGGEPGEVRMAGLRFAPSQLVVGRGTEVVFANDDVAPHTVTASDGSVDSGVIPPGGSFALVIDGPLDYVCAIHPDMQASVVLEG